MRRCWLSSFAFSQKFAIFLSRRERACISPLYVAEPAKGVVIRVVVGLGRKRDDAKKERKKRIYM